MKILALGVLLLGLAGPVQGQAGEQAPSSADSDLLTAQTPDDRRSDLANRLVAVKHEGLEIAFVEAADDIVALAEGSAAEQAWMRKTFVEVLTGHARRLLDQLSQIYAAHMTLEELEALVAFHESPIGRQISRKELDMSGEVDATMQVVQMQALEDLGQRYCRQFDCDPGMGKAQPVTPRSKPR